VAEYIDPNDKVTDIITGLVDKWSIVNAKTSHCLRKLLSPPNKIN